MKIASGIPRIRLIGWIPEELHNTSIEYFNYIDKISFRICNVERSA